MYNMLVLTPCSHRSMLGSVTYFSHFSPLYQQPASGKTPTDKLDQSAVANTTGEKETKTEKEPHKIVKLFQEAKKLVTFYKDGIKLLWANNKTAKSLKEKVEKEGYVLSRDEYQLVSVAVRNSNCCIVQCLTELSILIGKNIRKGHDQINSFCRRILHFG